MLVMEFMLRFTLSHPAQSTTIISTTNPQHLADNVAAARSRPCRTTFLPKHTGVCEPQWDAKVDRQTTPAPILA